MTLDIVEYTDQQITLDSIMDAADVLGIPIFERVIFPHMSADPNKPLVTPSVCPVGYVHLKRLQQMISKKNSTSIDMSERSAVTGQATGKSKNGRCSDLEAGLVLQYGLNNVLKELYGCRSDDLHMKEQMMTAIQEKGYFSLDELESDFSIITEQQQNIIHYFNKNYGIPENLITYKKDVYNTVFGGDKFKILHANARFYNFGDNALAYGVENLFLQYFSNNCQFIKEDVHSTIFDRYKIEEINKKYDLFGLKPALNT